MSDENNLENQGSSTDIKDFDFQALEMELEAPQLSDEIPEKFQGKSQEDIITMYQNLEKEASRKGNELGEMRKLTDQLLQLQIPVNQPQAEAEEEPIGFDDLMDSPDEAIRRTVNKSQVAKKVSAAEERLQKLEFQLEKASFDKKHSDMNDIVGDPEFLQWVQKSEHRIEKLKRADAYDFNAADELLSTFKEIKELKRKYTEPEEPTEEVVKVRTAAQEAKRKAALSRGTLEKTNNTPPSSKIFKRAEIIKLRMSDPDTYADAHFQEELRKAYREGRVK